MTKRAVVAVVVVVVHEASEVLTLQERSKGNQ